MRSLVPRSMHRAVPLALLALLPACTDRPSPIEPPGRESGEEIEIQALTCTTDVRAGSVSCVEERDEPADGLPSIVLDPEGRWVRLTTSNSTYAGEVLTFDVTVQSLVPQTLGVAKSGQYDGAGVRVFFAELPVVTSGTGSVTVNGAETGKFTRAGQLFYRYAQTLERDEVSAPRQWSFNVPSTVNSFHYRVLVAASVQYPQGWVELPHGPVQRVERAATRLLKAVVRNAVGQDVTASADPVTWSVGDTSVATVSGSTLTGAAISGLTSITATSGKLSASARIEVGAPFTQISAGGHHTCGLTTTGHVYCWGGNDDGELGDNTRIQRPTPVRVADETEYVQISAGFLHTCALTASGQARCWGSNWQGALGDGTTTGRKVPVPVQQGAMSFTSISAGQYSTCALTSAGQTWCWGRNASGQLGDGTTQHRLTPVAVQQRGIPYDEIATGTNHTCARASRRLTFCWGANESGQLGNNTLQPSLTPVRVLQGTGRYVQLRGGADFTCARSWNGQSYCWGLGTHYQLGHGSGGSRRTPVPVLQRGTTYVQIAAAYNSAYGITAAGQAWYWGFHWNYSASPAFLQQGAPRYVEIDGGGYHTCGRTAAGRVHCWGDNSFGQLGNHGDGRLFPLPVLEAP